MDKEIELLERYKNCELLLMDFDCDLSPTLFSIIRKIENHIESAIKINNRINNKNLNEFENFIENMEVIMIDSKKD